MIDLIKSVLKLGDMPTIKLVILAAILAMAGVLIYWAKAQYDQFIVDTEQNGYDQCVLDMVDKNEQTTQEKLDKLKEKYENIIAKNKEKEAIANTLIDSLREENERLRGLEDEIPEVSNTNTCDHLGDDWLRVFNSAIPIQN